jgi:hypothetical protein
MVNITTNTLFVAKVADLGLAKVKSTSTVLGRQTADVGSTLWMAPETPHVDAMGSPSDRFHPMKLDVYSFGIICYEILSREEPFHDVMKKSHVRGYVQAGSRPQLPDEIPRRLDIQELLGWQPASSPGLRCNLHGTQIHQTSSTSGGKH